MIFSAADGVPAGKINDLYLDGAGRLWIGSSRGGISRIDDPAAEHPTFLSYTTAQGLSSNYASAIVEDLFGRIYIGTGQGLDRLDPATGRIRHFTTADGLAPGIIGAAFRAHNGELWFGTAQGLSRFVPEPRQVSTTRVPIMLTGLRIADQVQNVSAIGETELRLSDLAASGNQLQIDFVGLSFAFGESLRYQYRLEGTDKDWGAPTIQRTVNYANLAPGRYRFLVRALTADGRVSETPAIVVFNVRPHFWQRWWFIMVVVFAAGMIVYAFYRYRVRRLLEIAGMRTRIATDLHDDIGANLTRISLLSEIAKQRFHFHIDEAAENDRESARKENGFENNPLVSISRIARESVSSMSDIVWSIDPDHDTLLDLTRKMRQHADEVFTLRDIDLQFNAASTKESLRVGVDVRRDLLLIFKEAVNNAARHSRCARVAIDLRVAGSTLLLDIVDDGLGFDDSMESEGQGLRSMKRRAKALSGTLEIKSSPGAGTSVRFSVPVANAWRLS